jgi:hypothetical protein
MNKNILGILALILVFTFTSCDDTPVVFDNVNGQTMVQFVGSGSTQPVVADGTSFTEITVFSTTISNVDRDINIEFGDNTTATNSQYSISGLVIPAGSYEGTIRVAGVYANLSESGDVEVVEINLVGLGSTSDVAVSNGTFSLNLFRFCPVQIGDYTIDMHDSYGDGWQTDGSNDGGDGLIVTLVDGSGNETIVQVGMCSPYNSANGTFLGDQDCTPGPPPRGFLNATTALTVPAGTVDIIWEFPGDAYGEISFEIYAPNDKLLYASGGPGDQAAAVLPPFIYCL